MAEYIEREAVIDEIDEWKELYQDSGAACDVLVLAKRAIRKIPAADVRPVVTCADCKHGQGKKMDFWNEYEGIECVGGVVHRKDWFCADGEKREES